MIGRHGWGVCQVLVRWVSGERVVVVGAMVKAAGSTHVLLWVFYPWWGFLPFIHARLLDVGVLATKPLPPGRQAAGSGVAEQRLRAVPLDTRAGNYHF